MIYKTTNDTYFLMAIELDISQHGDFFVLLKEEGSDKNQQLMRI